MFFVKYAISTLDMTTNIYYKNIEHNFVSVFQPTVSHRCFTANEPVGWEPFDFIKLVRTLLVSTTPVPSLLFCLIP